jgi:hypothetical protein
MTALVWDDPGERFYQKGVDRGVLGLMDGTIVPWNGITGVEEGNDSEVKSFYLDGVKFLEHVTPGDFVGKLSAFTYPEEFNRVLGQAEIAEGLSVYEQPPETFNLSYRTLIGNDITENLGYKIHIFYNLSAVQDSHRFETLKDESDLSEFSWSISGIPVTVFHKRSTVRVTVDSTKTDPTILQTLEDSLYGTASENPWFPSMDQIRAFYGEIGALTIVDNGDGTWTALDPSNDYIDMLDSETFEIEHADADYSDPDTYTITTTELPMP